MEGVEVKETMVAGGEGHSPNPTIEWTEDNGCLVSLKRWTIRQSSKTARSLEQDDGGSSVRRGQGGRAPGGAARQRRHHEGSDMSSSIRQVLLPSTLLHHNKEPCQAQTLECSICQATFTRQHSHLNYHHDTKQTRFNCPKLIRTSFHNQGAHEEARWRRWSSSTARSVRLLLEHSAFYGSI